jgi:hypothetical protein
MNRTMELAEQTQSRATTLPGTTQAGGEQFNKKTTRSKDFWHTATVRPHAAACAGILRIPIQLTEQVVNDF